MKNAGKIFWTLAIWSVSTILGYLTLIGLIALWPVVVFVFKILVFFGLCFVWGRILTAMKDHWVEMSKKSKKEIVK